MILKFIFGQVLLRHLLELSHRLHDNPQNTVYLRGCYLLHFTYQKTKVQKVNTKVQKEKLFFQVPALSGEMDIQNLSWTSESWYVCKHLFIYL